MQAETSSDPTVRYAARKELMGPSACREAVHPFTHSREFESSVEQDFTFFNVSFKTISRIRVKPGIRAIPCLEQDADLIYNLPAGNLGKLRANAL